MTNEDDGIVAFQLWDTDEKLVTKHGDLNKLPISFHDKVKDNFLEGDIRNIYRKTDLGSVRIVVKKDAPLFQGSKGISRGCAVYLSFIPKFKQIQVDNRRYFDSIIRRFAHNLVKFQTRFKGNFDRLISDNARSRPFDELSEEVKRRIESNTMLAAQDVCEMSHRAVDLDAQIETLRIISGYADSDLPESKIKVNLQKTIFRLVNPFIKELNEKNIKIVLDIPKVVTGSDKVLISPGHFNAAVWQILDNASKYILEGTDLHIYAFLNTKPQRLEFEMVSVCIEEDELEKVFLEGYKGKHSGNKAVSGIGLFVVRKALNLMQAKIYIKNEGHIKDSNNFKYCKHRFVIEFTNIV